jgi:trimeric autotransporter adhesin
VKVCWQVTGCRKDPWALANPFQAEQEKPERDRGCYLAPELYDAPEERRVWNSTRELAYDSAEGGLGP